MHPNEVERIASSELVNELYGDITKYKQILAVESEKLLKNYPDPLLDPLLKAVDSRVINLCPMVLCDALLTDLGVPYPDDLLAGIGLAMFSISTHDDVVDELPGDRDTVAGLVYAGNIVTLEGLKLLAERNYSDVIPTLVDCINKNHYHQTKIANTLWKRAGDEAGYLDAIKHTGYWIAIGLNAALTHAKRPELAEPLNEFAMCYGLTCQIFDDMREIPDDIENGYWSLPRSIARERNLDLNTAAGRNEAIARPREIALEYISRAKVIVEKDYPSLFEMANRIEKTGRLISY